MESRIDTEFKTLSIEKYIKVALEQIALLLRFKDENKPIRVQQLVTGIKEKNLQLNQLGDFFIDTNLTLEKDKYPDPDREMMSMSSFSFSRLRDCNITYKKESEGAFNREDVMQILLKIIPQEHIMSIHAVQELLLVSTHLLDLILSFVEGKKKQTDSFCSMVYDQIADLNLQQQCLSKVQQTNAMKELIELTLNNITQLRIKLNTIKEKVSNFEGKLKSNTQIMSDKQPINIRQQTPHQREKSVKSRNNACSQVSLSKKSPYHSKASTPNLKQQNRQASISYPNKKSYQNLVQRQKEKVDQKYPKQSTIQMKIGSNKIQSEKKLPNKLKQDIHIGKYKAEGQPGTTKLKAYKGDVSQSKIYDNEEIKDDNLQLQSYQYSSKVTLENDILNICLPNESTPSGKVSPTPKIVLKQYGSKRTSNLHSTEKSYMKDIYRNVQAKIAKTRKPSLNTPQLKNMTQPSANSSRNFETTTLKANVHKMQ